VYKKSKLAEDELAIASVIVGKQIDKAAIWLCLPAAAASFSASLFSLGATCARPRFAVVAGERVLCLMRKQHSQSRSKVSVAFAEQSKHAVFIS
jgi:hypothetical protein